MEVTRFIECFTGEPTAVLYWFTALLHICTQNLEYQGARAVIIDPVVDMSSSFPLPHQSPYAGQEVACRRANQGLYGEVVECVRVITDIVKIEYGKVVYGYGPAGQPYKTMWMPKNSLKLLKQVAPRLLSMIPMDEKSNQQKLVLARPWQQYSVGTCFVRAVEHDTQESYGVYIPNFVEGTYAVELIPHYRCTVVEKRTTEEMRALFLQLLFDLIDEATQNELHDGVVPYVWGGCSFITPNERDDFFHDQGAWYRSGGQGVCMGYDCSGLIWRIAQCAGITFPWKVSALIGQSCRQVSSDDPLENGDIVWFAGHAMVVADIENNIVLEAVGYSSGFGCVHAIPLHKRFAHIQTYADLLVAHYDQKEIELLDSRGNEIKKVKIRLLKLTPPYQKHMPHANA
jgi:hypothetical protein